MQATVTVEICNKKGLHARAAAKFVKIANSHDALITVMKISRSGEEEMPPVVGTSILGLLMLGADPGSTLHIIGNGNEAQKAVDALKELVENKFGEAE